MEILKEQAVEYKITTVKNNNFNKVKIKSSRDAAEYARNFYHEDISIYESFFVMYLNRANTVTGYMKLSQGGITGTVVDIKLLLINAISNLCSGVILVHNHPSGNLVFSDEDKRITEKIKTALKHIDVVLLDHVILTEDDSLSFTENGN
jgi:DNA repair protein RadC